MEIAAGPLDSLLAQWLWKPNEKNFEEDVKWIRFCDPNTLCMYNSYFAERIMRTAHAHIFDCFKRVNLIMEDTNAW